MLQGCFSAMVTPMLADGQVDYVALAEFVEWQIASGISGLVVVGSTGEAAALAVSERLSIIQEVIKLARGRIKIIVGSGSSDTHSSVEFIQELNQLAGIDYLMALTPYYVRPTQDGLYQHFARVAVASRFPIILYNVPQRTGCDLSDEVVLRLAHDFSNIVALKDATGDIRRCLNLVAHKAADFSLLSGDDASCVAFTLCGGNGVISAASNVRPQLFNQMIEQALAANNLAALAISSELIDLCGLLFSESNPIPLKWALAHEGRIRNATLRLPLTELSLKHQEPLAKALARLKDEPANIGAVKSKSATLN